MVYFSQQIAQMKQIYEHQALSCHPEQGEGSQQLQATKFAARFLTSFEMTLKLLTPELLNKPQITRIKQVINTKQKEP